MAACSHCGKPLADAAAACRHCGFNPNEPQADLLDPGRYRAKTLAVCLIFAGLVAAAAAYLLLNPGPPLPARRSADGPRTETLSLGAQQEPAGPAADEGWSFDGQVLDLASLAPIAGASLTFLDAEGSGHEAVSDAQGRYRISLPASRQQYQFVATHQGYGQRDFRGTLADFKALGGKRLRLAREPDGWDRPQYHAPWLGVPGKTVRRDVFLIKNP